MVKGSYAGFAPYEGQQFLAFAAGGGSVSQVFATPPGVHYALSLAAGKYGSAGVVSVTAAVWADDGTLLSSNQFTPASGAWALYPFGFNGDDDQHDAGVDGHLDRHLHAGSRAG